MSDFDKIIKSKISDYPSGIPDDMWSRVEAGLPAASGRKLTPVIFWFSGGVLLLALLSAAYFGIPEFSHNMKSVSDQEQISYTPIQQSGAGISSPAPDAQPSLLTNTAESEKELVTPNSTILSANNNRQVANPAKSRIVATSTPSLRESVASFGINNIPSAAMTKGPTEDNVLADNASIPEFKEDRFREMLDFTPFTLEEVYLQNKKREVEISRCYMGYQQDCPSFVKDKTGLYLDFYISHDYGIRNLSAKRPEDEMYRFLRDSTETSLYSFSAGARLSFILPNGFGIKTGLNYSQINEKFSQVDQEAIRFQTVITIDTIIVNGQPVIQVDTNRVQVFGLSEIIVYNRYRMLDLPILFSYEFGQEKSRIYYSLNAGIHINLMFSQKGRFLSPQDGEPVWFTSNDPSNYRAFQNSVGLTLVGSFGAYYRWTNNMDIMIEPNFKYTLKSITLDAYPLDQKYLTVGLITGIRYRF